ncbi:unnamed protein product [Lasius platythorax]|uniref:BEN domain-containing protein n=1 Tax=Lasius platythorax TaxID=488582 RepID=A0AAV2MXE6_9HYME
MNDDNCVLCEFHNEGDSVAVGYREWFLDEINDEALDDIIKRETEIKMRWPMIDIGSSNVMKKRLKMCEWQEVVAKIFAYGKWADMCKLRINLEKYGVVNPTKKDRKIIKKKNISDLSDCDSNIKTTKTKQISQKKAKHSSYTKEKHLLDDYKHQREGLFTISSEESSLDERNNNISQNELVTQISSLKIENKRLKADNERLRTLRAVTEDTYEKDRLDKILKEGEKTKQSTPMIKSCTAEYTEAEKENEHPEIKEEIMHTLEHRIDSVENDTQKRMTNLGGTNVMVNTVQLARCNHTSISKLTCDLLTLLFTRYELSGSSLTGKVSNIHLKKGATPKNKLDPSRVEAIKSYVMLKFGDVTNAETIIFKTIKQKCNNSRTHKESIVLDK